MNIIIISCITSSTYYIELESFGKYFEKKFNQNYFLQSNFATQLWKPIFHSRIYIFHWNVWKNKSFGLYFLYHVEKKNIIYSKQILVTKLSFITNQYYLFTTFFLFCFPLYYTKHQGREAKCANLLAENDIITPEGMKANLSYTLITQREPEHQVHY